MNRTTFRRRIAGGAVALAAVAALGGSHGLTAHAAAAPTTMICDEFGSCYDDGVTTSFTDPNSSWMDFWDSNTGLSGSYDTNSGDLWSSDPGLTDPNNGILYDPGVTGDAFSTGPIDTGSYGGGSYDTSGGADYSGLYDPGSSTDTVGG